MSEENGISAERVIEAILKGDAPNGEYVLDGKTIVGKFDLRHRVISVAVMITNCVFEDEVDLSDCEFKQCVNFSESRFKGPFDSRKTIYQKDAIYNRVAFEDEMIFNGSKCQGTGFFRKTHFENLETDINFAHAKFGGSFYCIDAIFKGGAIFNSVNCEKIASFHNAQFENTGKVIDFTSAMFGDFICIEVVFRGGANFNSLKCERAGSLNNIRFENIEKLINFDHARFGIVLVCDEAVFKGGVSFNSIKCDVTGFFRGVQFENTKAVIDFGHAKFGFNLDCSETVFKGGACFDSIQCELTGFFIKTEFDNKEEEISFVSAKCNSLEFQGAKFAGKVSFAYTEISKVFVLWKTEFHDHVNFSCMNPHTFWLKDSGEKENYGTFRDYINLQRLTFTVFQGTKEQQKHIVDKQAPDEFSMDPYLQFEKYYRSIGDDSYADDVYYEGRKKLHENAKNKINPDINWSKGKLKFDWLNWLLLGYGIKLWHTFIALAGFLLLGMLLFLSDEAMTPKSADVNNSGFMMTIDGEFRNDFVKGISKEFRKQFEDKKLPLYQKAFTGIVKDEKEWWIINYPSYDILYKAKMKGNDIKIYRTTYFDYKHFYKYYNFYKRFFHRLGYSLDMLLPIADLKIADEYRFPSGWRGGYMVIHILAGWILIPLLISSLAGVLRKR